MVNKPVFFFRKLFSFECIKLKMIFIISVVAMVVSATYELQCPQLHWVEYKAVNEDSWSILLPTSASNDHVNVTLWRRMDYWCSSTNLFFDAFITIQFRASEEIDKTREFRSIGFNGGDCLPHCRGVLQQRQLTQRYDNYFYEYYDAWSSWTYLANLVFSKTNCESLHLTQWVQTSNCLTSPNLVYARNCTDCDGDYIDTRYCNEISLSQVPCRHAWSEWTKGDCVSSRCNSSGERVRTRNCLYGNGSEALNVQLCSDESPNITEPCVANITTNDCNFYTHHTDVGSNVGLSVGIGAAFALLVVLTVLLTCVIYSRRKRDQLNQTVNVNFDLSPINPSVTRIATTNVGPNVDGNLSDPLNCDTAYSTVRPTTDQPTSANEALDPSPYETAVAGSSSNVEKNLYDDAVTLPIKDSAYSTLHAGHVPHANDNLELSTHEFAAADATRNGEASMYDVAADAADHDTAYSTLQTSHSSTVAKENVYSGMPGETSQENDYSTLAVR